MVQKGTVAKKGTSTLDAAYDYVAGVYLNGKKPYIYSIYKYIILVWLRTTDRHEPGPAHKRVRA